MKCDFFFVGFAVDLRPRTCDEEEDADRYTVGERYRCISQLRLQMMANYGVRGRKLLDVGCGRGHFVNAARAASWDAWGVDLDAEACAYANRRFGLRTVLTGSLDHPALSKDFDVVTLWNVVEHVPDPLAFLRQAADRLRPDGLIVIRTDNIRSWRFDRDRHRWRALGLSRPGYFSPRSLREVLSAAGFRLLDMIDRESTERPGWRPASDISQTPLVEGVKALTQSPAKLRKVGSYWKQLLRRMRGELQHGALYRSSMLTAVAVRGQETAS